MLSKSIIFSIFLFVSQSSFAILTFSKDGRPYDGKLNEIQVHATKCAPEYHHAVVTQRIAFYDRMNGQAVDNKNVLGGGLNCQLEYVTRRNLVIKKISCVRDDRPVDGALNQIDFKLNMTGLYDVNQKTSIYSRAEQREIKTEKVIGTDLEFNLE